MSEEVVVRVDGLPRPATVVERAGDDVLVRLRQGDGEVDRWVRADDLVQVEAGRSLPTAKLVGLAVVALLGLLLLLWPSGSDRPLVDTPTVPSATASP